MTTIREYVVAMGVDPATLQDTDEYFEVVQTLTVGTGVVKTNADLINPDNALDPTDLIQIRRRVGALSDVVVPPIPPYAEAVAADSPAGFWEESISFDGAQTKVSHPDPNFAGAFSLEAWVTPTGPGSVGQTAYGTIMGYSGSRRLLINYSTGVVLAQIGPSLSSPAAAAPTGAETYVVYVWDGSYQRIYANGVEVVAGGPTTGPTFTEAFWEGAYGDPSTNYSFKGSMRRRAVYGAALTAGRVAAHYESGTA